MTELTMTAQGYVSEVLPVKSSVNAIQKLRLDGYGDQFANILINKKSALAGEGSYFVTTNPTPGTGVGAGPLAATYANTAGWFFFQNWNAPGGPNAYLDYLKIIVTAAIGGGTVTNWNFVAFRDVATALSTQITTATSLATATPNNVNGASTVGSKCILGYQGGSTAIVNKAPSASSAIVGRASCGANGTTGQGLIGDSVIIDFGGYNTNSGGGSATSIVQPGVKSLVMPPLVVAPGQQIMIVPWFPTATTTGLNYEFELTHIER